MVLWLKQAATTDAMIFVSPLIALALSALTLNAYVYRGITAKRTVATGPAIWSITAAMIVIWYAAPGTISLEFPAWMHLASHPDAFNFSLEALLIANAPHVFYALGRDRITPTRAAGLLILLLLLGGLVYVAWYSLDPYLFMPLPSESLVLILFIISLPIVGGDLFVHRKKRLLRISAIQSVTFLVSMAFIGVFVWNNVTGVAFYGVATLTDAISGCGAARTLYSQVAAWDAKLTVPRERLLTCDLALNEPQKAAVILDSLDPAVKNDPVHQALRWEIYIRMDDYDHANYPDWSKHPQWLDLLETLLSKKGYDQADNLLRPYSTSDRYATYWLAEVLYHQAQYRDSIDHFKNCLNSFADVPLMRGRCLAGEALALLKQGHTSAAQTDFSTALTLNPYQDDRRTEFYALLSGPS